MIIEISDDICENELRDAFGNMPPIKNKNPDCGKKSSPVLHHVSFMTRNSNKMFLIVVIIYKAILRELKRRKIIIYNADNDTWRGVDYDGD